MIKKYKVRFSTADQVEKFINTVNSFKGDVNIYLDNKQAFDGKSLIVLHLITTGREVDIEFVGDEEESNRFKNFIEAL